LRACSAQHRLCGGRQLHRDPNRPPELRELLLRARVLEVRSYLRENVASAQRLYEEALQRSPQNASAMLGVARMNIVASMNFLDPTSRPTSSVRKSC